ncbi:MAG TPA: hypothetical protein DCZ75_07250 [Geobacter sp.]|nr:hypothetical protein [Geobacter sp.]
MDKQEINNAITEHAMWKFDLNLLVQGGTAVPAGGITESECRFGKWLEGVTSVGRQKSSLHYRKVKQLHAEFHRVAAKVAQLAAQGKKGEAESMMGFGGELAEVSGRLTEALNRWKESI